MQTALLSQNDQKLVVLIVHILYDNPHPPFAICIDDVVEMFFEEMRRYLQKSRIKDHTRHGASPLHEC